MILRRSTKFGIKNIEIVADDLEILAINSETLAIDIEMSRNQQQDSRC